MQNVWLVFTYCFRYGQIYPINLILEIGIGGNVELEIYTELHGQENQDAVSQEIYSLVFVE